MEDNAEVRLEPKQKPDHAQLLAQIDQHGHEGERLQMFDAEKNELWFACGDGKTAVFVSSNGDVKPADKPFDTKLTRELVLKFLESPERVDGTNLLQRIQKVLREHLYFTDERVYLFHALWLTGTYLYSMFSNFGYFFLYSQKHREGKTRNQEVSSHLAYESVTLLNAPTAPSLRDIATMGGTLQLDTLERWRQKAPETYGSLMELLDAGFRNGGELVKQVPGGSANEWKLKFFPVYTPYAFAAINRNSLSGTAIDRSFEVETRRKPIWIKLERYRRETFEKNNYQLRFLPGKLYFQFEIQNSKKVLKVLKSALRIAKL